MKISKNYNLSDKNSLKLNSICAEYIELEVKDDLKSLFSIKNVDEHNFYILGEGSNVILPEIFNGSVLHPTFFGITESHLANNTDILLTVGAGESWTKLIAYTLEKSFYGLENLTLIPGSVGAAPIQNIGAYGVEVCECVESVEVYNFSSKSFEILSAKECEFAYRDSLFKRKPNMYLIISVSFLLKKKSKLNCSYGALENKIKELGLNKSSLSQIQLSEIIANIRRERLPNPMRLPNAGSFFKNPIVSKQDVEILLARFPKLVFFPQNDESVKLSAAWLIDFCAWKGRSQGDLQVSEQHALVLINKGKANKQELLTFAQAIQDDIYNMFSLRLEIEPVLKPV